MLTAFVMVAAVFAYVVVGAELTSSYTAGITVNEDVKPTTSPIELAGGVIAKASDSKVNNIILTLQLAANQSPVDIGTDSSLGWVIISYSDNATYLASTNWTKKFVGDNNGDELLEQ